MPTYTFPHIPVEPHILDGILSGRMPVYLYGTSSAADARAILIPPLSKMGINILGILSLNPAMWGKKQDGIEILPASALTDTSIPVIICADSFFREVSNRLKAQGVQYLLPYYFYLSDREFTYKEYRPLVPLACREILESHLRGVEKPLVLHSLDVMVSERCSLRCRDCSNLMQYYQTPEHEDTSVQLEALDRIMASVDGVHELRVLGGEPFVNPELCQYINHMKQYSNAGVIGIYTNGTIVPKGENLRCLQDMRVYVRISNYGPVSSHLVELQDTLRKNGIFFEVFPFEKWLDCSGFENRNRSETELAELFKVCCACSLYTLKGGCLYGCPFSANASALRAIPAWAAEGIHVCREEHLRECLRQMKERPYLEACRFCAGRPRRQANIPAAVQADAPRPYERQK